MDIDIEQFFDKVNHDKLIQILREQVNDSITLISKDLLENRIKDGTGLVNPLSYYLTKVGI